MKINKLEQFNLMGKEIFRPLSDDFGYTRGEAEVYELDGSPWSTKYVYLNTDKMLKIEILQEPYYTDYGFSFLIYNLNSDDYNIICNVPHEKQDSEGKFLYDAAKEIFGSPKIMKIIKGEVWENLDGIYFKR